MAATDGDRISELDELTDGTVASGDYLVVVDTDVVETKKIQPQHIWDAQIVAFAESVFNAGNATEALTLLNFDAFAITWVDDPDLATLLATLGLDGDLATLDMAPSVTISAFMKTLLDDADAPTARTTLGTDQDWTYGSQVTLNSGTSVQIESAFPSGLTDIEILIEQPRSSLAHDLYAQIGDAGGLETSGYASVMRHTVGSPADIDDEDSYTTGFLLAAGASILTHGVYRLISWDVSEHLWMGFGQTENTGKCQCGMGFKTLSGEITTLNILCSAGNFTQGEARVRYR